MQNRLADGELRMDLRIAALLFAVGLVLYLPGIHWGLPEGNAPDKTLTWAVDELGSARPVAHIYNTLRGVERTSPQYPLLHYLVVGCAYLPYLALSWISGGFTGPQAGYPYGFADPARAVQHMLLIARAVSSVMGAGIVVTVFFLAKRLWNRRTGVLAALITLLLYPMFYYARISNVDVPALFWMTLTLALAARSIEKGLTTRRAIGLGVLAAFTVATKDQYYASLLFLAPALAWAHWASPGTSGLGTRWKPLLAGLVTASAVYAVASGLLVSPRLYVRHLRFISTGSAGGRYFRYEASLDGYLDLVRETLVHITSTVGWPLLLAALVGVALCLRHQRSRLFLLLPVLGLLLGTIAPVRHVTIRFLMLCGVVAACYAGAALEAGWRSRKRSLRALSTAVLAGGCLLLLLRAGDVTWMMWNDPRDAATEWLQENARPGDTVEYFVRPHTARGRVTILPRVPPGVQLVASKLQDEPGIETLQGRFVLLMGPNDHVDHKHCPRWVYEGLFDGRLNYTLAASFENPTLFPNPFLLNQRVTVFVRSNRAEGLGATASATIHALKTGMQAERRFIERQGFAAQRATTP